VPHAFNENLAENRYFDPYWKVEAAKILPGEYFVSAHGMVLVTVLGSCVAACIRDTGKGVGGMNHFMLPDGGSLDRSGVSTRYGVYAMEVLINHLIKLGARRNRLEAKVFGGGAVLSSLASSKVGARNAGFVRDYLKAENIPIVAEDLLGSHPRKLYYFPDSGRALVKKLHQMHNDTLFVRERVYQDRLSGGDVEGDIELFV
jgi:chemotaxis protein CheD